MDDLTAAVEGARRGDSGAFRILYREAQPRLLRYLNYLVGSEAEDIASEAWLQAARDLGKFHGSHGDFRRWISTIARNRAMDHLRRANRQPPAVPVPVEELTFIAGREDTADRAIETITTEEALSLIASLPPDQAEAVLLRAVVGLDAKGAGQVVGKRPGAIRTAAYRGLKTIEKRIERPGDRFALCVEGDQQGEQQGEGRADPVQGQHEGRGGQRLDAGGARAGLRFCGRGALGGAGVDDEQRQARADRAEQDAEADHREQPLAAHHVAEPEGDADHCQCGVCKLGVVPRTGEWLVPGSLQRRRGVKKVVAGQFPRPGQGRVRCGGSQAGGCGSALGRHGNRFLAFGLSVPRVGRGHQQVTAHSCGA
jgi:RNA polymerase sigma-70 factor (ECF subfamily)